MRKKAIGMIMVVATILAACSPATISTAPPATGPTTAAPPTAPVTTTAGTEKPQYGGTLNLAMIMDISSWDQGLTGC